MTNKLKYYLMAFVLLAFVAVTHAQYYYGPPPPPPKHSQSGSDNPKKDDKRAEPSGYIMASLSLTNPLGAFAASYGSGYGNYALGGDAECISAGIPIANTNVGVALMYGFYDNPYNLNEYVTNLNIAQNNQYYGIYSDDYSSQAIMAGLFYTWPVNRLSFDFRAMAGIVLCQLPEITYGSPSTNSNAIQDNVWDYASSASSAFGYDIGAGIRYKLRRGICVSLYFDYLGAVVPYNTSQTYTNENGIVVSQTPVSGTLPISMFNVSFGVGYQFK